MWKNLTGPYAAQISIQWNIFPGELELIMQGSLSHPAAVYDRSDSERMSQNTNETQPQTFPEELKHMVERHRIGPQ